MEQGGKTIARHPSFSSRLLFLDAWAFDGDTFILPTTSVFTHILSGAVRWRLRWRR
jgi:hypothetical protein